MRNIILKVLTVLRIKDPLKWVFMSVTSATITKHWKLLRLCLPFISREIHARLEYDGKVLYRVWPWEGEVDLVVESFGCCGTTSFVDYLQKHNPEIRLAHHCHYPCALEYAVEKDIPAVALLRDPGEMINRRIYRHDWHPSIATRRARDFFRTVFANPEILELWFVDYITNPASAVDEINARFPALKLNRGDGDMPHANKRSNQTNA